MSNEIITLCAPALGAADIYKVFVAFEGWCPNQDLRYELTTSGSVRKIADRVQWIEEKRGEDPWAVLQLCNGNSNRFVSVLFWEDPPNMLATNVAVTRVQVTLVLSNQTVIDDAANLVASLGESIGAWCGSYTPAISAKTLRKMYIKPEQFVDKYNWWPYKIPRLRPRHSPDPRLPDELHWVNYWSRETAELLKYPDSSDEGTPWFVNSRELDSGAWSIKLTDDPLDSDDPEHLEIVARAYARFKMIGHRET